MKGGGKIGYVEILVKIGNHVCMCGQNENRDVDIFGKKDL